jgi:hypothetical protein
VVDWVRQSSAFRGTVLARDYTSPDPWNPDPARQLGVRLDRPVSSGQFLHDIAGQEVMVLFPDVPTLAVGDEAYFFVRWFEIGRSVSFELIGLALPGAYSDLETMVPAIERALADRALYDRMVASRLVVLGVVGAVETPPQPPPCSEHSPLWNQASVATECQLLGGDASAPMQVRWNASDDVSSAAPQLGTGERAILLLQPDTVSGSTSTPFNCGVAPPPYQYALTNQLDVQPPGDVSRLLQLLACPPAL